MKLNRTLLFLTLFAGFFMMSFVGASSLDTTNTGADISINTSTTFASHTWHFSDTETSSHILNRTDEEYLYYIRRVDELCRLIPKSRSLSLLHSGDVTYWKEYGVPNCGQFATAPLASDNTTTDTSDTETSSGESGDGTTTSDTVPPTITILGENPVRIQRGLVYGDSGVRAIDNISEVVLYARVNSKDPTGIAKISIDTNVVGENKIEYYASDASGNKSVAKRIVYVYEPATTTTASSSSPTGTSLITIATASSTPLFDNLSTIAESFSNILNIGTTSTLTTASSIIETEKINIAAPISGVEVSGVVAIKARSAVVLSNMIFKVISLDRVVNELAARTPGSDYWVSELDTTKLSNGAYFIVAEARLSATEIVKSNKVNIFIRNAIITVATAPANNLFATSTTDIATSSPRSIVTWECRDAGITELRACEEFMFRKNMPTECRERLVLTQAECDRVIAETRLPKECIDQNITNTTLCAEYKRTIINIAKECIDSGIKTETECKEFIFKKIAPKECVDAGIYNKTDCEKHIFLSNLPSECRNANILNAEACKKFMFEKVSTASAIPAAAPNSGFVVQIQTECKEAGLRTSEECNTFLKKKYLPNECKDKGIESESDCNTYLTQKRIPKECRDSGIIGIQECDRFLFEKNLPKPCVEAGITDINSCREYSFDQNQTKIRCNDSTSCEDIIKERHMGALASTQQKFEKITEVIKSFENKPINIGNLTDALGEDRAFVPIVGTTTSIILIKTDETISLDGDEDLVQTSPVAIMFDSDNDGLSDDFERRIGTNPNSADSDGDGMSDADEIKSNENPSGDGELQIELAPVEVALLSGSILEHPKTSGIESEDMSIDSVSNIESTDSLDDTQKENGYVFKGVGVPYSVVTLYIYSDLPLVVTMQTDKYGNWQYELDRPLSDGEHEVYVAVNDNTGKIVEKSGLLSFFVKEAQAFSVDEYLASANTGQEGSSKNLMTLYLIITVLGITLAVFLFGLFLKQKSLEQPKIN